MQITQQLHGGSDGLQLRANGRNQCVYLRVRNRQALRGLGNYFIKRALAPVKRVPVGMRKNGARQRLGAVKALQVVAKVRAHHGCGLPVKHHAAKVKHHIHNFHAFAFKLPGNGCAAVVHKLRAPGGAQLAKHLQHVCGSHFGRQCVVRRHKRLAQARAHGAGLQGRKHR